MGLPQIIKEYWRQARTEVQKLVAVKLMAAAALPEFLEPCRLILTDVNTPILVRIEAFKVLEPLAKIIPEEVSDVTILVSGLIRSMIIL